MLNAIETDFNCSSMCDSSKWFSFSDVSRGIPPQNCTIAIERYLDDLASKAAGTYGTFAGITLVFFIYLTWFAYRKKHDIESPLLWKKH